MTFSAKVSKVAITAVNIPLKWVKHNFDYMILQGERNRFLYDSMENIAIRAEAIERSKVQRSVKAALLQQALHSALERGPRKRDFRMESIKIVTLALIATRSYKEAFQCVGRLAHLPLYRRDILDHMIRKMFDQEMSRDEVVRICEQFIGRIPGMKDLIDDIYRDYPIVV